MQRSTGLSPRVTEEPRSAGAPGTAGAVADLPPALTPPPLSPATIAQAIAMSPPPRAASADPRGPLRPGGRPDFGPESIERQVEVVQREMDGLRCEMDLLRRRDETLHFYMHRLDEELRLAARLQQDFLPKNLPQLGKVRFHTVFRPAGYVSGDLYDVMRLDERNVGFYMADAVGHGVPAALLTMFIKHALQTKEIGPAGYRLLDPGEALRRLNERLIEQNLSQATFATALYGMIDADTHEVTLARAGHPAPVVLRADGSLEAVDADGPLLGIFPDETFQSCRTKLYPGDRLFVYTDGVEVAFWNEQSIETLRWRDELFLRPELTTAELLRRFTSHLDGESGSLQPKDDLTLIVIEVEP